MSCPYQDKMQKYLEEELPEQEMKEIEKHMDSCTECQEELERIMDEPLRLSQETIAVEDDVLIGKIKAHRKGIRRIFCYGILGFIIGLFSRFYTSDSFIVTKAFMALPYKVGEFVLEIFFSKNRLPIFYGPRVLERFYGMGFFPYNPTLDFIAEIITPALITAFMAIILGYLVSDSRVFRRKKLIRFIALGLIILGLWCGVLHGIYLNTLSQIEKLNDIREITVYSIEGEDISWLIGIDEHADEKYTKLLQELSHSQKVSNYRLGEKPDMKLLIRFGKWGQMEGDISLNEGIMHMQNSNMYSLTIETVTGLKELMEVGENE